MSSSRAKGLNQLNDDNRLLGYGYFSNPVYIYRREKQTEVRTTFKPINRNNWNEMEMLLPLPPIIVDSWGNEKQTNFEIQKYGSYAAYGANVELLCYIIFNE